MADLLHEIQQHLDSPHLRDNLTPLFCQTLNWGKPSGQPWALPVGAPVGQALNAAHVAQLGGLPVLRIDWPAQRLPNVTQRRAVQRALAPRHLEHLLCYVTENAGQAAFVWARQRRDKKIELRTLPYEVGTPARTSVERLGELCFAMEELGLFGDPGVTAVIDKLNRAFDVEAVTKRFFQEYHRLFEQAEQQIKGLPQADGRIFTQRLFNRLLFVRFLEKKGWLAWGRSHDYLRALWAAHRAENGASFFRERLELLFFCGLNNPQGLDLRRGNDVLAERIGRVPYLNGGLFERERYDDDDAVDVPDAALEPVLTNLFYRFNFTVTETTPLDIEVAVDPEMLGKMFEELVTGRHETGSYYTPKPVVQFMCREALTYYLREACPGEADKALERFVEERDPVGLCGPESVLEALRSVRVCDPACGSGAYLLGMLHELLELRQALFAAHHLDASTGYERKLQIIENNLYGVDIDPFATNIARLRLWLSLMVDYEGDDPPPLPNLDFKIGTGDSLTAPPPQYGTLQGGLRDALLHEFRDKKAEYLREHAYGKKQDLRREIDGLRQQIALWAHAHRKVQGFDWAVEFAEVFAKKDRVSREDSGGFDIVLTNPPYVRQELLGKDYKEKALKPVFAEVYSGTADLYVYFYARAQQLLCPGGVGCFISSNKWLRAGYGEKLRQHLLDGQAFRWVVDFGELPVFSAATFPAVFLWQKQPRNGQLTRWAVVKDLAASYEEGIRAHAEGIAQSVPASQFGAGRARLATPADAERRTRMERSGPRLGEYVGGQFYRGIVSGFNRAFVVDLATRDRLIAGHPASKGLLKPLLTGDDARRYELHYRDQYYIFVEWQCEIERFPTILAHLRSFQSELASRPEVWERRYPWYAMSRYGSEFIHLCERPKIMYPVLGTEPRFGMDVQGYYGNDKTFFIASDDWYLLGVLNSMSAFAYLRSTCSVLGDEMQRGRLEFRGIHMRTLPVPSASLDERRAVAKLAQEAQRLHGQRRARVEPFLRALGLSPAQSSSRNPLEEPWRLTAEEVARHAKALPALKHTSKVWQQARDETAALTEQIARVERAIDERVAGLYGVDLPALSISEKEKTT